MPYQPFFDLGSSQFCRVWFWRVSESRQKRRILLREWKIVKRWTQSCTQHHATLLTKSTAKKVEYLKIHRDIRFAVYTWTLSNSQSFALICAQRSFKSKWHVYQSLLCSEQWIEYWNWVVYADGLKLSFSLRLVSFFAQSDKVVKLHILAVRIKTVSQFGKLMKLWIRISHSQRLNTQTYGYLRLNHLTKPIFMPARVFPHSCRRGQSFSTFICPLYSNSFSMSANSSTLSLANVNGTA